MKSISSRKSTSRQRKIIILAAVIALIGVGAGAYYVYNKPNETTKDTSSKVVKEKTTKETTETKDSPDLTEGLPENSEETTNDQVASSSSLSVKITSTSQENGMVNATATTNGSGTCVFTYSVGDKDKPVTKQVTVSGKKCISSVSQVNFNYIGSPWTLKVTYYSEGKKTEASKSVAIH